MWIFAWKYSVYHNRLLRKTVMIRKGFPYSKHSTFIYLIISVEIYKIKLSLKTVFSFSSSLSLIFLSRIHGWGFLLNLLIKVLWKVNILLMSLFSLHFTCATHFFSGFENFQEMWYFHLLLSFCLSRATTRVAGQLEFTTLKKTSTK